ncbi:terpene synthase metal binding domain-containing protein [Xylaria venustula]|nr:terpene synthase metal binding domain-containing protein [Xylaria venustula]
MSPSILESADRRLTVVLPDFYKEFLVQDPTLNTHYEVTRVEAEHWFQRKMSLPSTTIKKFHDGNFSYFASVHLPHAPKDKLKLSCDWLNWAFAFDDAFDDGELTKDPQAAERLIKNVLSIMVPGVTRSSEELVVSTHDDIYLRLSAGSPPGVVKRYVRGMTSYCAGLREQVKISTERRIPKLQELLNVRRNTIGVYPLFAIFEYAYDLNIPDIVFSHPSIQELETLGIEMAMLINDAMSYRKEEISSEFCNFVALYRITGLSAQEAFDKTASLVDTRFARWNEVVQTVPSWGSAVDIQVQQYIQGIQNVAQATISHAFEGTRYFGLNAGKIRQSRVTDILIQPPFPSQEHVVV